MTPRQHPEQVCPSLCYSLPQAGVSRSSWLGVTVLDENDWWPEWDRLHYQGSVLQTAATHAPVFATHAIDPAPLTVTAHDRDQGYNGRVTYSIVEKDVSKYFSIDQHTGLYPTFCFGLKIHMNILPGWQTITEVYMFYIPHKTRAYMSILCCY